MVSMEAFAEGLVLIGGVLVFGAFGYYAISKLGDFLELELLCCEGDREAAVDRLLAALDRLAVPRSALTRRSYLGMLQERQRENS